MKLPLPIGLLMFMRILFIMQRKFKGWAKLNGHFKLYMDRKCSTILSLKLFSCLNVFVVLCLNILNRQKGILYIYMVSVSSSKCKISWCYWIFFYNNQLVKTGHTIYNQIKNWLTTFSSYIYTWVTIN